MTRPFSATASPMASRDSSTAESMKPQVLTMQIGPGVSARDGVALCPQPSEDALGIDRGLGTAEADEADAERTGLGHVGMAQ